MSEKWAYNYYMNNFDFNIENKNLPIVKLTTSGLLFNEKCVELLGKPKNVRIGFDRENRKLAVQASDCDNKFCPHHRFFSDEKKKSVLITNSKIKGGILKLINIPQERNGIKFLAEYDKEHQMLIVDLTSVID